MSKLRIRRHEYNIQSSEQINWNIAFWGLTFLQRRTSATLWTTASRPAAITKDGLKTNHNFYLIQKGWLALFTCETTYTSRELDSAEYFKEAQVPSHIRFFRRSLDRCHYSNHYQRSMLLDFDCSYENQV